jgi:hypothetical protein
MTHQGVLTFLAAYAPTEDSSPTVEFDQLFKLRPIGFGKRTPLPLIGGTITNS